MAIVHDLAEAIVGDFTPFDNISNEEKHRLELNAIETFVEQLNNTAGAIEIKDLWLEYEAASSQTAILCKDIDKFEMIMQAYEYEQDLNLESFFESTNGKFKHQEMKTLAQNLYSLRNKNR